VSNTDIRVAITSAVIAFKMDTGQLPIRLQVSRDHLNELEYSTYEFPRDHVISIDYVEDMSPGVVRCIGPEVFNDLPD
jgi:hypothetical protein